MYTCFNTQMNIKNSPATHNFTEMLNIYLYNLKLLYTTDRNNYSFSCFSVFHLSTSNRLF